MKTSEVTRNTLPEELVLVSSLFPDQGNLSSRMPGLKKRLLILGTGELAVELSRVILTKNWSLLTIVGFLDGKDGRAGEWLVNPGIVGTFDQLAQVVEQYRVDSIVVCLTDNRSFLPTQALLDYKAMGVEILDGHGLFEEASGRLMIDSLRPSSLIFSTGFRRRLISVAIKRIIDVVSSVVGLVILSPLLVLIAALIKADTPGPVLYRQARVGLRGRLFQIWKFRSMRENAEMAGPQWAQANDSRISRVGWWLRKTRLDEIPQLVNVLRGEMSLVGPRPERPVFVKDLRKTIPYYDLRHTVRPGLSGWAQVRFRYAASGEDAHTKLQYDLYYVKRFSLALDFRVLLETVQVVLFGKGAH